MTDLKTIWNRTYRVGISEAVREQVAVEPTVTVWHTIVSPFPATIRNAIYFRPKPVAGWRCGESRH